MKILRDHAIFSDTEAGKLRAVNELVRCYHSKAVPIIKEVIDSTLKEDQGFRAFCLNAIEKIKENNQPDPEVSYRKEYS